MDAVFHLAGALTSRGCTDEAFIRVNIQGTFHLLKAVRERAPALAHFVYASSDAVYFERPDADARYPARGRRPSPAVRIGLRRQ